MTISTHAYAPGQLLLMYAPPDKYLGYAGPRSMPTSQITTTAAIYMQAIRPDAEGNRIECMIQRVPMIDRSMAGIQNEADRAFKDTAEKYTEEIAKLTQKTPVPVPTVEESYHSSIADPLSEYRHSRRYYQEDRNGGGIFVSVAGGVLHSGLLSRPGLLETG